MQYIGFDYHKQFSYATSIDSETGIMRTAKVENTAKALEQIIDHSVSSHAVLEASRTWPVLYEMLKDQVNEVKLAHPARVKAIAAARIKNDRIDSRILAELLAADLIPEAHIRNSKNRMCQAVVRQRVFFVESRTRVKNRIHVLIDRYPCEMRHAVEGLSDLFGKVGMDWLRHHAPISPEDRVLLDQLLNLLDLLNDLISESNSSIRLMCREDANALLLTSMPGIAEFLAVLISTEIDDISRFPNADKLVSYIGIAPSTYSSGTIIRHGRITKQGNKWLRWAFVEAALKAKDANVELTMYYTDMKNRKGPHCARIALARRLVKIVYSMLKYQRPFIAYKKTIAVNSSSRVAFGTSLTEPKVRVH